MPFDRVVVSSDEINQIKPASDAPHSVLDRLPSPVPWWARMGLSALALALPLLCVVAVILRVAFRGQPPRVKYAWVSFLSTHMVVSGFLTTVGTVLFFSFVPVPAIVNAGLPDLDERNQDERPALTCMVEAKTGIFSTITCSLRPFSQSPCMPGDSQSMTDLRDSDISYRTHG
jgi:hypothetical protein